MDILTVEDDPNMQILIEEYLKNMTDREQKGFSTGAELLDWLDGQSHRSKGSIDLILMDIDLPGVDGITLTKRLREDTSLANLPVVVITTFDDEQTLEKAFEAGCTDYLTKPLSKIEFRARVKSALRLKNAMDKARQLANRDALTELYNRRFFNQQIKKEFRRASREGTKLSFILCDIDYFKQYNDTYGHSAGDETLKAVADVLGNTMRRPGDFVARYGGEEFAVILPNTDRSGAQDRAEAIRTKIESAEIEHESSKVSEVVTVSIGFTTQVPSSSSSPLELINAADAALYEAKEAGRNTVRFQTAKSN
jgi:diguanylate cyclase (GGDEF)-like protein